jgi:hypothetical protein
MRHTHVESSLPGNETVVFNLDVRIRSDVLRDVVFVGPESHAGALKIAVGGVDEVECLATHDDF